MGALGRDRTPQYVLGVELREMLRGLFESKEFGNETAERARARRSDPDRVLGSKHFASVLAYGNFELADGPNIRCEAIPGISGVITSDEVTEQDGGHPKVNLERVLTHFHFDQPQVLIEQSPWRKSVGTLTGSSRGGASALLPGKATFAQFLILSLNGRPLANREALVMTAERVDQWPPLGSSFISERPTQFFDVADVDNVQAKPVASLIACNAIAIDEVFLPGQGERETIIR